MRAASVRPGPITASTCLRLGRVTTSCLGSQGDHPSRRQVLLSTTAVGLGASSVSLGRAMPAAAAAGAAAGSAAPEGGLPLVPTVELATGHAGASITISRVIKGCWQLSGGHAGERASDHTNGKAAVGDFQAFVDAGVTTFDTADICERWHGSP